MTQWPRTAGSSRVACSHPERIVTLSQQVAAGAALLQEQSDTARRAVASVGSEWHGSTASLFERTGAHLATELARKAAVLSDIASTLMDMASTLDDAHVLWHQAEIAQSAAVAGALPGMPIDNSESDSLAAQAREHVTLAVQRGVLAFSAVTEDTWYFSGRAFGGLVHAIEQELTHQWRVPDDTSLLVPGDPASVLGLALATLKEDAEAGSGEGGQGAIGGVDDVLVDPDLLQGKSPRAVRNALRGTPGWREETLGRGSRRGSGWVFREYDGQGRPTGRLIRWHPGGGHHGPDPYWRVSQPDIGKSGVIPAGADDLDAWWDSEGGQ